MARSPHPRRSLLRSRGAATRPVAVVVAFALAITLAACGSNLDPDQVNAASGTNQGTGEDADSALPGTVVNEDGTVVDPGDGTAVDPGDGTAVDPGSTDDPGGTDDGPAPTDPPIDVPSAADCEGLKNGVGITDDAITIGNSSDISGPVPGLFETAQDATKAFVAYFNASVPEGICGRKLELKLYDSQTDASADQQAYTAACEEVFAMVGSQSAFDLGGAKTAQSCGLPDIRAGAVTFERNACTTCFAAQAVNTNFFQNAVPEFVKKTYGDAAQHVAYLYTDAGAAAQNAKAQVAAMEKQGLNFDVVQGIGVTEFNYTPFVQQLKDNDIEVVFFTSSVEFSVRLRQAMQQQQYEPKVYLRDPTDYNPALIELGGDAVDGTVVFTNFTPFEEASSNKETALYTSWLQQVKPGADPLFFGVFAWSAARLFVEKAAALGSKLSRATLIAELKKVKDWTAQGMHAPQPVGSKGTGECWRFIQLNGGKWSPVGGTKYSCAGLTSTN